MRKKFLVLPLFLIIAAIALSGCEFTYSSYTIDCERIIVTGIDGTTNLLNYDSNGDKIPDQEQIWVYAVDGAGNVLLDMETWVSPLGHSIIGTDGYHWNQTPQYNPITFKYLNKANGFLPSDIVIAAFTGECAGLPNYEAPPEPVTGFKDGRINRLDWGAPIAVYPISYGARGIGLHIYAIQDDSTGKLVMEVTPEELMAGSGDWELLAANESNTIQVFKYLDGWQINANAGQGKIYVLMFDQLNASSQVDSYTTDPQ